MYLDQHGFVRACCMNDTHVLGNVRAQRLEDIWRGERARSLRQAMAEHDLGLGCDFCRWPIDEGRRDLSYAAWFDHLPVAEEPEWPSQIEFSVSNTCNLQCTMCNGEWSSSIRSQREGLPPLPKVYDDDFFEDLRPFLPHLTRVKFLGGEPFLAAETLRVMEMLVEVGSTARCHVTTNGTQWTPRVERILEMLPVDISLSLDAATAATYERIRIGSDWEVARRNLDRFVAVSHRRGTEVSVTMCLMTLNWHEFADFCLLADRLGISCDVNTVVHPTSLSLYHLPVDELEVVVAGLEAADQRHGDDMDWSRRPWTAELERLRRHLDDRRSGVSVTGVDIRPGESAPTERERLSWEVEAADRPPEEVAAMVARTEARRRDAIGDGSDHVRLDLHDRVVAADRSVLGLPGDALLGRPAIELVEALTPVLGSVAGMEDGEWDAEDPDERIVDVRLADGRSIRVVTTPAYEDGQRVGTDLHYAWVGD
jgi:MoaA/NifB/PqqE/SkfB family radical SAM enzyme